jgi:hypothetical protein
VFGTLFATTMRGEEAGNRFEALVIQFLSCIQNIGVSCHPTKKQPIWLSKYSMLGLLRCRQHFIDYTYPHSLYEGGIEGKGMVKELRPLCPNAVRIGWPLNLIDAYNRQNILASLTNGFQQHTAGAVPTNAYQQESNAKRYTSWSDVRHAWNNHHPLSIIVLGSEAAWTLHVRVHMFQVDYLKEIIILSTRPLNDPSGYVYHNMVLAEEETLFVEGTSILSFGLMLPNIWQKEGEVQYCVVNKDWRFLGLERQWTYL